MKKTTITSQVGQLRFCGGVAIAVFLCGSAAFALDPMGPPAAGLRAGQWSFGGDYSSGEMDIKLNEGEWEDYVDGLLWDWGKADSLTIKNLKMNKVYANFGLGMADNLEVFFRIGGSDARFGDSIWEDGEKFDEGCEFALGGGLRATFYEDRNLKIGALLQASGAEFRGRLAADDWVSSDSVDMDIAEIQFAIGPTLRVVDGFWVYGGPFFHFINGSLDDEFSSVDGGGVLTSIYSWDIDERSFFGGYIGAQLDLGGGSSFNIEYQHTSDAEAVAASLVFRF
ncbi:MAG: hypothetical protein JSU94_21685 [Phycisphaerales bacterium]|nr:MAG: hypothetical protein JSU94_21685 [Phycisphaerales bacterium]